MNVFVMVFFWVLFFFSLFIFVDQLCRGVARQPEGSRQCFVTAQCTHMAESS